MTQPRARPDMYSAIHATLKTRDDARLDREADAAQAGRDARNAYWITLANQILTVPHGDRIFQSLSPDHREMVAAALETMESDE